MKRFRILTCFMLVTAMALTMGCNDEDEFTTSLNNQLAFSSDTIRLDTTFSKVPTSTKTFWVYNKSGKGIRLTNVRLEQGNQTGFRVNVDGIYLGLSSGYQVNDLEIRNKDSIRVFVELTSPLNGGSEPTLIEDNLIFTLESSAVQKVNLNAYSWDAELIKNLDVTENTMLQSEKPLVIQGGIKVAEGATLTIGAGTTLYFSNKAGIDVGGSLKIEGTADKVVTLRGDRLDRIFDYLPYDRVSGQWQGIHFHSTSYNNEISYTDIHSAYNGIICDSSDGQQATLTMQRSTLHNCQGYGIFATNCKVALSNCQITNTLNDCAAFIGGSIVMNHCTIAQFYPFDGNRGVALLFGNTFDGKNYGLHQFEMHNSLVTGYSDNVLMSSFNDETEQNYKFSHSILRNTENKKLAADKLVSVQWEDPKDTIQSGVKHFIKIDSDKQIYDFHLSEKSKARDAGYTLPNGKSLTDHDNVTRDSKPDIGCYEYKAK